MKIKHYSKSLNYSKFFIGNFRFARDKYFAYIYWPSYCHVMPIDIFLKALTRMVAEDFVFGTINFDDVLSTIICNDNIDLVAGSTHVFLRQAQLHHQENFPINFVSEVFNAMLIDWISNDLNKIACTIEFTHLKNIKSTT